MHGVCNVTGYSVMTLTIKRKQYVDSLRFALETLERTEDFSSHVIVNLRHILVQHIAELEDSIRFNDRGAAV